MDIYVKVGIGLIVLALLVLAIGSLSQGNLNGVLKNTTTMTNFTIAQNSFYSYKILLPNASSVIMFAKFDSPVNMYFANASAYASWSTNSLIGRSSGLALMSRWANNGLMVAYKNVTVGTIPPGVGSVNTTPFYNSNQIVLNGGTYYLVADNTYGSASANHIVNGIIAYLPPLTNQSIKNGAYSSLTGAIYQGIIIGLIFYALLFAGIVLILYGMFKKRGPVKGSEVKLSKEPTKQEINKLYGEMKRGKKRSKK